MIDTPWPPRRGVGTAVFGGMIAATALGVFVIPLLYIVLQRLRSWGTRNAPEPT